MNSFLKFGILSFLISSSGFVTSKASVVDDNFLDKIIISNNVDNDDSIDSINEPDKASSNNVEVIIQLFDEHPNDLNLFLEDDYENLLSLNTAFYKSENDKTFNLFNLKDYSNYYKCENIPFLVYNYDNVEDFYKSDFNKLSKYSEHIKNVFIETPDYHDCANRNSSTFSTSYKFGDALADIGIPTTKSFDGSGIKIGSIELR